MKTLIYMETKDGQPAGQALELVTAAKKIGEAEAVLTGAGVEEAAGAAVKCGISAAVYPEASSADEVILAILEAEVNAGGYEAVLFAANQAGKDLAPRLAQRLKTGCVTDVTDIDTDGGQLVFRRPAYGGTIFEKMVFAEGKIAVATIRSGSFEKAAMEGTAGGVDVKTAPGAEVKAEFVDHVTEIGEAVDLQGADVIVSAGRGCGTDEKFAMVGELAKTLGGVVGATRPIIESGFATKAHQVGQSGKIVAPKLYVACGISGSMQHVSGILDSNYIIAINKDADAPIFDVADIGIVGKCEEIIPLLTEAVKG